VFETNIGCDLCEVRSKFFEIQINVVTQRVKALLVICYPTQGPSNPVRYLHICSPVLRPSLFSVSVDLCVTSCSSPKGRLSPDQPWSWSWVSDCARTCERSTVSHCACSKTTDNQRTAITRNTCYYNILNILKTAKKNFHSFYAKFPFRATWIKM